MPNEKFSEVWERIEKSLPTAHLDNVFENIPADNNPEPGGSVPTGHFPNDVPAQPSQGDDKK